MKWPFPDATTPVVVIGATGGYGRAQIVGMKSGGANVVGITSPGRGGETVDDIPVFDSVADAVRKAGAIAAVIYTPAAGCGDSVVECAEAGIRFAVAPAEFMPIHDALYALARARETDMWVVGPNTLGMAVPGECVLGSIAKEFTLPGPVAVFGRSGTLTATASRLLSKAGIGQRVAIHIGGDVLCGRNPHEYFLAAAADPKTKAIAYLGEIGGTKEYEALEVIQSLGKPVATLIIGLHAPAGRRMGHAGALVEGERGTARAKRAALKAAGAHIVENILELPNVMRGLI
jgi:succinyl-CoA synthetase alpha subunit